MNHLRDYLTISALSLFFIVKSSAQTTAITTQEIPGTKASFKMALVPGGSFIMGNEGLQRTIQLDSFWMGTTEVGYDEFIIFYHKENDSNATTHPSRPYMADAVSRPTPQYIDYTYGMGKSGFPAVSMTQQAALRYCQWLYTKTGVFYRWPTEAEWEYACRYKVGSSTVGSWQSGAEVGDYAWFYDNSYEKYHELAQKKPNSLGLYDMLGTFGEASGPPVPADGPAPPDARWAEPGMTMTSPQFNETFRSPQSMAPGTVPSPAMFNERFAGPADRPVPGMDQFAERFGGAPPASPASASADGVPDVNDPGAIQRYLAEPRVRLEELRRQNSGQPPQSPEAYPSARAGARQPWTAAVRARLDDLAQRYGQPVYAGPNGVVVFQVP